MAKHKNHIKVVDRLLQTNKPFSQLKQSQKEKINEWLYDEYSRIYDETGAPPDKRYNDEILDAVYEKINVAGIWLPFGELKKYYISKKSRYKNRYDKTI